MTTRILYIIFLLGIFFHQSHATVLLPAKIQAQTFTSVSSSFLETTQDVSGEQDLGWLPDGSWADYQVEVPASGYYAFTFRIANGWSSDASIQLKDAGNNIITESILPTTGGMQSWKDVKAIGFLNGGVQTIRMYAKKGVFSINWINIEESVQIPARIEAENFAQASDVRIEASGDIGGGNNVGYIDDGDWMEYAVKTTHAKTFRISLRVANSYGNGLVKVQDNSHNVLAELVVPKTGGWQNYVTIDTLIALPAGNQKIRIFTERGAFNLKWIEFSVANVREEVVGFVSVPAIIEAEDYFEIANVNTENTEDINGGLDVGWMGDGSWLTYKVQTSAAGLYTFDLRVANGFSDSARIQLWNEQSIMVGQSLIPRTGGMQAWDNVRMVANLVEGPQILKLFASKGVFSINRFEVLSSKVLPGIVEAENYVLRTDVRTEATGDTGGGVNVSYIDDHDWLDYNVTVPASGAYTFRFRVANSYGNGQIFIKNSAGDLLGQVSVPQTGGWQNYATVETSANLISGSQLLRIYANRGSFNFNWFEVVSGGMVEKAPTLITFSVPPNHVIGGAGFPLVALSNNNEAAIVFQSSNTNVVSVSYDNNSWTANIVGVGTANITASQPETASFLGASTSQSVQVTSAEVPFVSLGELIPMEPKRWYQLTNVTSGLDGFFDGITQETVQTGWGKVIENYDAYYPLLPDEHMTLKGIKFFDLFGSNPDNPMTVSVITENWERIEIASFKGLVYNGWVGPYPDAPENGDAQFLLHQPVTNARYIVISMRGVVPTEIEFYGSHTPSSVVATPVAASNVRLGDMFGVNGYEWNFEHGARPWELDTAMISVANSFTGLRHYMDWEKLESQEGVYSFAPTLSGGWDYDKIYQYCKEENIEVLACLKGLPQWMQETYPVGQRDGEHVPVRYGSSFTDPLSYIDQARIAFQYAARYGSNTQVDPSLLSVYDIPRWHSDVPNVVKIGLDLIKYIECDNERDKWWKGREGYQTAREYAANLSAFYDGHKNTMGPAIGIKNADPNMKVVVAGLVTGPDYIKGMVDWCKEFRGYKPDGSVNLCWDVINFHLYTDNTSSAQSGNSTRGAAIETTNAGLILDDFRKVAHDICYDMPVWITETGFDVNQGSPIKAIPIGNKSAMVTQADWILRTSLYSARKGIDKVFFYQMYDDNDGGGMFGSSGLLNGNQTRRPAADYLYQVNKVFGDYRFQSTSGQDPIIDRYQNGTRTMYVLTVPDEIGRTVSHTLALGGTGIAAIFRPTPGTNDMQVETVPIVDGSITVTATETPMFVMKTENSAARMSAEMVIDTLLLEKVLDLEDLEVIADLQKSVSIYPNPTSDYMVVNLGGYTNETINIRMFDAGTGRLFKEQQFLVNGYVKQQKVLLHQLPSGVYIVEISNGLQKAFRKVVKL